MRAASTISEAVARLPLTEREWTVLAWRNGPAKHLTLAEVGNELGITRERARQIQSRATRKLAATWRELSAACDSLELRLSQERIASGLLSLSDIQRLAMEAVPGIVDRPDERAAITRLLVAFRAIANDRSRKSSLRSNWPNLWLAALMLEPPIRSDAAVQAILSAEKKRMRRPTYREMAREVLERAGYPMHWQQILRAAEESFGGRRETIVTGAFFNALGSCPEFVRVDSGTYGLREWGLVQPEHYDDIAASILAAQRRTMSFEELRAGINARRRVEDASLKMMLGMNVRFYCSVEGKFGLRAWLPPRNEQTLLTPRFLVEDRSSHERVERARKNHHDVERIVGQDTVVEPTA